MKNILKTLLCCGVAWSLAGVATAGDPSPSFSLGFDAPSEVAGGAGSTGTFGAFGTLAISGLADEADGAQGWSTSLTTRGACTIVDITSDGTISAPVFADPPGLVNGGFEKSETTEAGCDGDPGAVSAIVLSFTMPIVLPQGDGSPSNIFALTVEATFPEGEGCVPCELQFVDGCQGSGQPVDNKITYQGETNDPVLGTSEVCLLGRVDCDSGDLNIVVSEESLGVQALASQGDAGVGAEIADLVVSREVRAGEVGSASIYASIVSTLSARESGGVQGWSLSGQVSGDLNATAVTTEGTAGGDVNSDPEGLRNGGFEKSELVDPANNGGNQGFVTAVVLSFTMPITLPEDSVASVVRVDVEASSAQSDDPEAALSGRLDWVDGLVGSGQPVRNVATVDGETNRYTCCQGAAISFVLRETSEFIRGDANDDAQNDIADAIFTVNALFRSGPIPVCADAADANDDGLIDVSDALYTVTYQFSGGDAPPAPFPACGEDPDGDDDGLGCDDSSACS